MTHGTCTIDGCEKPLRSRFATMCGMHYHRWYRHGSHEAVATGAKVKPRLGSYRIVYRPGHPVSSRGGNAYEHRVVLHDEIGPGPHPCHWCGRTVHWDLAVDHSDFLQVDHLNSVRDDNRLENLVPSCRNCNTARGQQARSDALRAAGWWSRNDTIAALATRGRVSRVA